MKTILILIFVFLTFAGFSQKKQSLFNGKKLWGGRESNNSGQRLYFDRNG